MLIIVSGQDSYRALEKARELERAYCGKYDREGRSVERLTMGAEGVERFLAMTAGGSLFSTRRFIRIDRLVSSCPKAKREAILKSLVRDAEMTIVVSLEEGVLTAKELKSFSTLPKFYQYDFPMLEQGPFAKWARDHAESAGITDANAIAALIDRSNGDAWHFATECIKVKAGALIDGDRSRDVSVYDVLDSYLMKAPRRRSLTRAFGDDAGVIAQLPNQARSMMLVMGGHREGMHPYVAQKLSRMKIDDPPDRFARLATAFVWSRTGYVTPGEGLDALG